MPENISGVPAGEKCFSLDIPFYRTSEQRESISTVWAFYVKVAVPMRLPDVGRLSARRAERIRGDVICDRTFRLTAAVDAFPARVILQ